MEEVGCAQVKIVKIQPEEVPIHEHRAPLFDKRNKDEKEQLDKKDNKQFLQDRICRPVTIRGSMALVERAFFQLPGRHATQYTRAIHDERFVALIFRISSIRAASCFSRPSWEGW